MSVKISLDKIAEFLTLAGIPNVSVEQTGGGVATLYGGYVYPHPTEDQDVYAVVVGPGSFEASGAYVTLGAFCYGPDDFGNSEPVYPETGDERAIAAEIVTFLKSKTCQVCGAPLHVGDPSTCSNPNCISHLPARSPERIMGDMLAFALEDARFVANRFTGPLDDFLPWLFVFGPGGIRRISAMFTEKTKQKLFEFDLPAAILGIRAFGVIHVSSAWSSFQPGRVPMAPSEDPNRTEILLLQMVTAEKNATYVSRIMRSRNAPPLLLEPEEMQAVQLLLQIPQLALQFVRDNPNHPKL